MSTDLRILRTGRRPARIRLARTPASRFAHRKAVSAKPPPLSRIGSIADLDAHGPLAMAPATIALTLPPR
ncbi:hypothetical protein [Paludibacterium paludis]|uniref:Uncharacterized protein n=1 Tax=Paludibacterium paludis TaxID=1225769 RepID=A0A918NZB8_9NEIS|nr:hypothetical protein [Paludibacterium paludis]GGY06701.1 hypothetical protein GCM10011289_06550 [Paludibacterium paludis]